MYTRIARVLDKWCLEDEDRAFLHWQIEYAGLRYIGYLVKSNPWLARAPLEFHSRNRPHHPSIQKRQDGEDWRGARINQGRARFPRGIRRTRIAECYERSNSEFEMLGLIGPEAGMLYRRLIASHRGMNVARQKASARNGEVSIPSETWRNWS